MGDITYPRTGQGWLYLVTVIDLATRMVTGWQIADHMRASLFGLSRVAIDTYCTRRRSELSRMLFNSDNGIQ